MNVGTAPKRPNSAIDFLTTRPEAMGVCHGTASGSTGLDEAVTAIGSAIGDNVTCLTIATGVVVASLAVVWYVGASMYRSLLEWRAHQLPNRPLTGETTSRNADRGDDVTYARKAGDDGIPTDLGPAPTAPIVAARMAKLAKRYSSYNAAMRQRAAEAGVVPDDIIDARILGRADDDWKYPRKRGPQTIVGGGSSRPWALRSPVYDTNPF